jgi:hypothetical protein
VPHTTAHPITGTTGMTVPSAHAPQTVHTAQPVM